MTHRNWPGFLAEAVRPETGEITAHTALRGLAALMVILYHCALASPGVFLWVFTPVVQRGYLFVDIFFILSGFILMRRYGIVLAQPNREVLRLFWWRRFLRIYPPYAVWLAIAILVWFLIGVRGDGPEYEVGEHMVSILLHVIMVQSILGLELQYNVPLWSITMEMIAYLLLPLLAIAVVPRSRFFIGALTMIVLLGVWLFIDHHGKLDVINGPGALTRCLMGFSLGALASLLTRELPPALVHWSRHISLLLLVLTLVTFASGHILVGYCAALGLVMISSTPTATPWTGTWLPMLLGRVSFSLYLAHVPVLSLMIILTAKLESMSGVPLYTNYPLFASQVVFASLVVAVFSWKWVEVELTARVRSMTGH